MVAVPHFRDLSAVARCYFLLVIALGTACVPAFLIAHPVPSEVVPELLYLGLATQVLALMPVKWHNGRQYQWTAPLVAAGLVAPGGGVALVAWLATNSRAQSGQGNVWWQHLFNRASIALTYSLPSVALEGLPDDPIWGVPLKALLYGGCVLTLNYTLFALAFSLIEQRPVMEILIANLGRAGAQSVLVLAVAGGIIDVLLARPSGYLLSLGLLGFLFVVRANVAYALRQREGRLQTLELAAQALDARDPYTESHSQRVAEIAVQLGEALNLVGARLEDLRTAGHLHDLGKIGIPDRVLNKPDELTPEEWALMKSHADIGADMLERHSEFKSIAPMVRAHHERWDGTGYPRGIAGNGIPLGARILAVADSYDTITEARVYRRTKMKPLEAVADISSRAGTWYDPAVVNALRSIHGLQPVRGSVEERRARGVGLLRMRRRFAWLLTGMTISAVGDPLTVVGSLVALYAASRSPLAVAAAYACRAAASVLTTTALANLSDRLPRQRVVVVADCVRGGLMLATPVLLWGWIWAILPILFVLGVAGAIAQPARQAAIKELVEASEVGGANALVQLGDMAAKIAGYPLAGIILVVTANNVSWLFAVDGVTFLVAAGLMLRVGSVGGGVGSVAARGGFIRAWSVGRARVHLVLATLAAFVLGMSLPTLIVYSYEIRPAGPRTYTLLEGCLAVGVVVGAWIVGRFRRIGAMGTAGTGLLVLGVCSVGFALAPVLPVAAVLLFLASVGNPIYLVGNQTAIMEAAEHSTVGTLMSVRYGLTQAAAILGSAVAGLVNASAGPRWTYALMGVAVCVLAVGALSASTARRMAERLEDDAGAKGVGGTSAEVEAVKASS